MLDTLFASIDYEQADDGVRRLLVKDLAAHIHKQGCMVMIHNCGTGIYFDVQIETMQPEAISFYMYRMIAPRWQMRRQNTAI